MKPIVGFLFGVGLMTCSCAYAAGDEENGKRIYGSLCTACHSVEVSLAGPAHRGVFGRKAGSVPDFDYSPALKKSKMIWTDKNLDRWLANPERLIPGQKMGVSVSDPRQRQDLIAYLRTLTPQ